MTTAKQKGRYIRIAEIANEILAETQEYGAHHVDAKVVAAVERARRAEYYERKEAVTP